MQNTKLLLICTWHGRNPCTKFGIDQVKGSKNIERTTQWARKRGLTTLEHVTWKSIGIIYSLRVTSAPSFVLIKWRGQKILSGQHLVYRPTDRPIYMYRPTDSCKTICPLFQGGHKNTYLPYVEILCNRKHTYIFFGLIMLKCIIIILHGEQIMLQL